ncbi:hypothetical protein IC235_16130 [Hymenobacter sp. BT664]|uniref:Uncharacterized protein n=1 Tax=Hymenobacter montanus TaxID=2771359 RepID=A0A927GKC1_9BACT|nr:hypothetical protein [Hymenobacter montanus]MBD2769418.1 hypothetical protein [Hymenobacter montanus]
MQIPPFFQHTQHVTGIKSKAPEPERYPFHDNDECPIGQEIKQSGDWKYYEPHSIAETRARCAVCITLNHQAASKRSS